MSIGRPSSLMKPEDGLYHLSIKPTMVLLPEPLWPWVGQFVAANKTHSIRNLLPRQ